MHQAARRLPAVFALAFVAPALAGTVSPVALDAADLARVAAPSAEAVRSRLVTLDLSAIDPLAREAGFDLELFPGLVVEAERVSAEARGEGRWGWSGFLRDEPDSVVMFAVRDGVAAGIVRSPSRGVFWIRSAGDDLGVYRIEELDADGMPPCAVNASHVVGSPDEPDEVSDAQELRMATVVDILVGYTSSAKSAGGGPSGILSQIDLAIDSANDAYQRSGVTMQLNLVHAYEVSYTETGNADTTLSHWRGKTDTRMDEVHGLRDAAAADVCCLLVANLGNACGIANLMTTVSQSFESSAFSAVQLSCAVGNFSFAHEIGHNMGCNHDRDNAGGGGAYQYSYGYRQPGSSPAWRTIMAYAPGTRIGHFSNPSISYQGQPTGVASGTSSANNAATHNGTKATVAAFRDSGSAAPLPFALESPEAGGNVGGAVAFEWAESSGALYYNLTVATNASLTNVIYSEVAIVGTSHVMPAGVLDNCEEYFWGVVAVGPFNSTVSSPGSAMMSSALRADLNGDGVVNTADLGGVLGSFGFPGPFADLNNDGIVNTADLGYVLGQFGQTCD